MGKPVRTCSSPSSFRISVPDAGLFPSVRRPIWFSNSAINAFGNPPGYTGNAWSSQIPAISQCPVVVSFPGERVAPLPYDPKASAAGVKYSNGLIFARPSRTRFGIFSGRDRAICPSVSRPTSPYSAASGSSPIPTLSKTIQMIRSKYLTVSLTRPSRQKPAISPIVPQPKNPGRSRQFARRPTRRYNFWFRHMPTEPTEKPVADQAVPNAPAKVIPGDIEEIRVRGARVHNLKNIDFVIPHSAITVVSGVSGSGKSSLAFDTLYAEGQRRYIESLSAYARQFLERIEKPDVDEITGIAPAIAIRQKNSTRNPRSTVATATEIYDYLRLLFARIGRTFCLRCGEEVRKDTLDEIAAKVLALPEGRRFYVLYELKLSPDPAPADATNAPNAPRARKPIRLTQDAVRESLISLRKRGFNRLYQSGRVFEFATPEDLLDVNFTKPVYVLVDRLALSPEVRSRLMDSIEICYREGRGEAILEFVPDAPDEKPERMVFNERFECKKCGSIYQEPEPRLFSFNNPYGACPRCQGFGNTIDFDLNLVIPDKSLTLNQGAIEPWTKPKYRSLLTDLKRFAREADIPMDVPWNELDREQRRLVIEGEGKFLGVRGFFSYLERKKYKLHVRVFLSRYRGYSVCSACNGTRLRTEARQVKINGKNICDVCSMTIEDALEFFEAVELTEQEAGIADRLLQEIRERLRFLNEVGLEYLTLDRLASTLSGGEAQRIQLATSLGSRLVGTLYVLDEPSIGLHSRDTHRLIKILHNLHDLGNTILVVEHDRDVMQASDTILDLGPGAGENGGKVIAAGTYEQIQEMPASLTGRYLADELQIQIPTNRRKPGLERIRIYGARAHNLKGIDLEVPLRMLVAITGVSGSGKSTLLHDVLYRALAAANKQPDGSPAASSWNRVEGAAFVDEVLLVDQSPIGRTPRSNPVTYTK